MTDTNPRDLIRRLADEFEYWLVQAEWAQTVQGSVEDIERAHNLVDEARAYLAQPEPEGLTDEALLAIAAASIKPYEDSGIAIGEYEPETERAVEVYGSELIAFARAVLARSGRPVFRQKELTDEQLLKCFKIATPCYNMEGWRRELDGMRAAIAADRTLCARPALKPVPVSEGLPKAEYCDAQGNCWLTNDSLEPGWVLDNPEKCTNWTHWVPHWAMPIVTK